MPESGTPTGAHAFSMYTWRNMTDGQVREVVAQGEKELVRREQERKRQAAERIKALAAEAGLTVQIGEGVRRRGKAQSREAKRLPHGRAFSGGCRRYRERPAAGRRAGRRDLQRFRTA